MDPNDTDAKLFDPPAKPKQVGKPEVCPEKFMGGGYGEYSYKEGWLRQKCKTDKSFAQLISVLINVVQRTSEFQNNNLPKILEGIAKFHPNISVLVATSVDLPQNKLSTLKNKLNLVLQKMDLRTKDAKSWNTLVSMAKTKYVLVARNITHFYGFDARLERLVRELSSLRLKFVGGALRTLEGHWSMNCLQMSLRNFTLTLQSGYDLSKFECVYCNVLNGPFVTLKKTLQEQPFDEKSPDDILFYDYFIDNYNWTTYSAAVCPDSMFYAESDKVPTDSWKGIALKYALVTLNLHDGRKLSFDCDSVKIACKKNATLAISPCCLQELVNGILNVLDLCKSSRINCEIMEGTLLSAVKIQSVFPWEVDADVKFSHEYYSKMLKVFADARKELDVVSEPK